MSSRPTSASMLSMLPQPIQPIPGDSFNDRILLLLAAVATTDDMLTYREYQLVQEAAQAIFGERALHAELQAKLHYALLNPPSDPADIARDMANQADAQKVSSTFVDTMLKALSRIGGQEERIDEKARSLVNDIEWAFRKSRLERSAGRGIGLGLNVGESLGELYRKATNVLPSRKEIAGWFAPETSQFNADMERFANSLDRIAWTLDDMDLREELYIFRKMLRRQPFKIVIVGERKRGKSSLIKTLYAEVPLVEGEGRIVGFDLRRMKRRDISRLRRSIGIVFQDYQLLSDRDVFGNLHYVMKATGWKNETDMRKRIEEVLSVVGLENKAFKMPFELSGGQQQRLAVARALVNNPRVILADEPTGNLDPWAAEDIMEVFRRIVAGGCSIVMSTHNIANIEQFPARTIRFNKGKVEEIDISSVLGA